MDHVIGPRPIYADGDHVGDPSITTLRSQLNVICRMMPDKP